MAANGSTLSGALDGANAYASVAGSYAPGVLDPTSAYPATPPANVASITAGFNAQQGGSLCTKP
jgi:hypothetical protein